MSPYHTFPALSLPLLLFAASWMGCMGEPAPDASHLNDQVLSSPGPSPSPFTAQEGPDVLKDPKVRRALIRALARSLENLGGQKDEPVAAVTSPPLQFSDTVRFHASLGSNSRLSPDSSSTTEVAQTTTEKKSLSDEHFISESILEQVDKQIKKGEFLRVPPNEVLVTSKTEPRPFSLDSFRSAFEDSLSFSSLDGGNSNSLTNEEITTTDATQQNQQVHGLRVEQHEIRPFVPSKSEDNSLRLNQVGSGQLASSTSAPAASTTPAGTGGHTVDIYRAPLIAAFTLHQDYETGATRGVVPILPAESQESGSSQKSQGEGKTSQSSQLPLPSDELRDLVRQIATHPLSSKTGRFPIPNQPDFTQSSVFNRQFQNTQGKLNFLQPQENQRGVLHSIQKSVQLDSPQLAQQKVPLNFNSANLQSQSAFATEQEQIQQRFHRIQTLQELQQLKARLDRLQRQVQVG